LAGGGVIQLGNDKPPGRIIDSKAGHLQPPQCFANRSAAERHLLGQFNFSQASARCQRAITDPADQELVGLVTARQAAHILATDAAHSWLSCLRKALVTAS